MSHPALPGAQVLPLALLAPSPTNPRKHFDEPKLRELASSIAKHGLMQPIVARSRPGAVAGEPQFEIVSGERRWRACHLAGVAEIPAIVRELDDFETMQLQMVENLQRDDLHPLEEADGYHALLRKPNGLQGFASVDELATRIGKSRSYVFQRLKLRALHEAGRQAFLAGELSASVALLIARLPTEADQAAATERVLRGWGGEPMSFRSAQEYIQREFMLQLSAATFNIANAELVPEAGACRTCPKRAGANPDLFADVDEADTCTDPACYQAKTLAHQAQQKAKAAELGMRIITGAEAKKAKPSDYGALKGYLELDRVHHELGDKPLRELLGAEAPEAMVLEDPRTKKLLPVVKQEEALQALRSKGLVKSTRMPTTSKKERELEAARKLENAWRESLITALLPAAALGDDAFRAGLQRHVAVALFAGLGSAEREAVERLMQWPHIGADWQDPANAKRRRERLERLTEGDLARYFAACCVINERKAHPSGKAAFTTLHIQPLADLLGIDHQAIRAQLQADAKAKAKAATTTPEKAFKAAVKKGAAKPTKVAVKYRCPDTGSTWTGRGLKPRWLAAALAQGKRLADFDTSAPPQPPAVQLSPAAADPFRNAQEQSA